MWNVDGVLNQQELRFHSLWQASAWDVGSLLDLPLGARSKDLIFPNLLIELLGISATYDLSLCPLSLPCHQQVISPTNEFQGLGSPAV